MSIALLNSYWDMFIDYKNLVFKDYQQKKLANAIPLNLMYPTSAKIKAECMAACELRFNKKDEKSLKTFFGQYDGKAGCLKAIAKCATDKFKPLANFLKAATADTAIKNIELLAWLIDFRLRPFEFGKKYDANEYEHSIEIPNVTEDLEKYMYWNGDHFEAITCSQNPGNSILVPFDDVKLSGFKKITNPETITLKAKGRVWYAKVKGGIEFFTSEGPHPTDQQLRLKPISDYIIKKYIFSRKALKSL
ncbi:hypothetical protein [Pinibacter aurantiacus]|uniref:Uncharacterized protein n=1 Tax=Pinibacter aurantiacus TaxID=2851599 RepID=A0A9E2SF22_9BACT|nr:hypothetical protein [Pinibacter aurantiacus]MBV4359924.1 hypothetical protein [Pinibacter aurantiacus]